jgi:hypothetical protein
VTADLSVHPAHETPLATRIAEEAVRRWLDARTGVALAAAGTGDVSEYERGVRQGIEHMRYLHLDNYWYTVVPQVLDEFRRAGLLA